MSLSRCSSLTSLLNRLNRTLTKLSVHPAAGNLHSAIPAHLGRGWNVEPVGLVLQDHGIDQVSLLEPAERSSGPVNWPMAGNEKIRPASVAGQVIELALVDGFAVELGDLLVATARIRVESLGRLSERTKANIAKMPKIVSNLFWWRRKTSNGMGFLGGGKTGRRGRG